MYYVRVFYSSVILHCVCYCGPDIRGIKLSTPGYTQAICLDLLFLGGGADDVCSAGLETTDIMMSHVHGHMASATFNMHIIIMHVVHKFLNHQKSPTEHNNYREITMFERSNPCNTGTAHARDAF